MQLDLNLINRNERNYWLYLQKYLDQPSFDLTEIYKAYTFVFEIHRNKVRRTGEPYISHSVWIAKVLARLGIGQEAVIAGLLHNVVGKDIKILNRIELLFGNEVASIVTGLNQINNNTKGMKLHGMDLEIFRKFLISSIEDVRVLIIRLVDKLHDGLTINSLPVHKRRSYAKKVLGVYAPMAEYVGLNYFSQLLEDIAFKLLYPKSWKELEEILKKNYRKEIKSLWEFKSDLASLLGNEKIEKYEVQARIKGLYSSYLKWKKKGIERLKDRIGFRVITKNEEDCYKVLGGLHLKYPYIREEFDDYISAPKTNGYQTIKTTLRWKHKLFVEVQIRTEEMHELAEFGAASHLIYKMKNSDKKGNWFKNLVLWKKNGDDKNKFKINILADYVYVFTPKGEIIQLKSGSNIKDFAFKIHSELGEICKGGRVNGIKKKKDYILKTGDVVKVL
jgi:GTP pyrophosphokinase